MTKPNTTAILPLATARMVSSEEIAFCADTIRTRFGVDVVVLPEIFIPCFQHDYNEKQLDAGLLLEMLFKYLPDNCGRIIGITAADMTAAGRTFVFGYGHMVDGVAVYSTARLREEWYDRAENKGLQQSRSLRCIVHELGHTFGNDHCEQHCIMQSGRDVSDLDALPETYCTSCAKSVNAGVFIDPLSNEGLVQRARANLKRRNAARAIMLFRRAAIQEPLDTHGLNDFGVAYLHAGNREAAHKAFRVACELGADFPQPYYNLGIIERAAGNIKAADDYFAAALLREKDKAHGHRYLAYQHVLANMHERIILEQEQTHGSG